MHKRAVLVGAMLVASGAAHAEGVALGAKLSTLGMGLELTKSFSDNINGRIGFNTWSTEQTGTEDEVDYNIEIDLQTVGAMVDWYAFSGSFRVSGGLLSNGNEINMTGVSNATYQIGDETYNASQVGTLTGVINFQSTAPYFGIGWGNPVAKEKGFGFTFDVGVMFQGSPEVELNATGTLANNAAFLAELDQEEANLQSDLDDFKYWPVVALGVSYQF